MHTLMIFLLGTATAVFGISHISQPSFKAGKWKRDKRNKRGFRKFLLVGLRGGWTMPVLQLWISEGQFWEIRMSTERL